jgi:hypothetical protein
MVWSEVKLSSRGQIDFLGAGIFPIRQLSKIISFQELSVQVLIHVPLFK